MLFVLNAYLVLTLVAAYAQPVIAGRWVLIQLSGMSVHESIIEYQAK